MNMADTVLHVPPPPCSPAALAAVGRTGLWYLAEQCAERGWDVNGAFALITEESGWNLRIKNPKASAAGLIQVVDATARSLGLASAKAYASLSGRKQLEYAFKYWDRCAKGRPYSGPNTFIFWGLGRAPGATGDVLYPAGHQAIAANPALVDESRGAITTGSVLSYFAPHLSRARALPRCKEPGRTILGWLAMAGTGVLVAAAGVAWYAGRNGDTGQR